MTAMVGVKSSQDGGDKARGECDNIIPYPIRLDMPPATLTTPGGPFATPGLREVDIRQLQQLLLLLLLCSHGKACESIDRQTPQQVLLLRHAVDKFEE